MQRSIYRALKFIPSSREPPETIISKWVEIERLVGSETPCAGEIISLLEISDIEKLDDDRYERYCFALYNLLQLLNEKRRKIYDSFFDLPSTTLGLRSKGGEFELGYFNQPLLPFGLILAIFRSDMEKTMERAAPWIEMIFSDKNRQIPGRVLMFDKERKKYFEKRNNMIQNIPAGEVFDNPDVPFTNEIYASFKSQYLYLISESLKNMTDEELDARGIPHSSTEKYIQAFRDEENRDSRKRDAHNAHPIMKKLGYIDLRFPEDFIKNYDEVMTEYNQQRRDDPPPTRQKVSTAQGNKNLPYPTTLKTTAQGYSASQASQINRLAPQAP